MWVDDQGRTNSCHCGGIRSFAGSIREQATTGKSPRDGGVHLIGGFPHPPVLTQIDADPSPLQERDWLGSTTLTWGAQIYADVCEHRSTFSPAALSDIVKEGKALANVAGGLVPSARQLQKIHMGEVQYARDFTESTQHLCPDIADELKSIHTRGAMPAYRPMPPKHVPDDGYPHNPQHTMKILESLWGDVRQMKALLRSTSALIYGERLEYTPTTTVPKGLPDRTFGDKLRTISDLRSANLGIDTDGFPPFGYQT